MSFLSDNDKFEAWLRKQLIHQHCSVVEDDLKKKHERMRESPFVFLRATYFRWAKRIESICPDLAKTPPVLSVGDLHLENFGTWRDAEGRLVWGVNDFDEAAVIPYAFDLVRLAASARLAANLPIGSRAIARTLIDGYSDGLERRRPTLLDEQERWMRPNVAVTDHGRDKFWHDIEHMPDAESCRIPPRRRCYRRVCLKALRSNATQNAWLAAAASGGPVSSQSPRGTAERSFARRKRLCRRPGIGRTTIP